METVQKKEKNDVKPKAAGSEAVATAIVSGADGAEQTGASVDKIRDILFGSQMRDYDKRFTRLEERLSQDAITLREEL